MSNALVALLVYLACTGVFVLLWARGMRRTTRPRPPGCDNVLSAEERTQWEQIERHWQ